jgi:hypothetical protein
MKKFTYYTIEIIPQELDEELNKAGANGWDLVFVVGVQRQSKLSLNGIPSMIINFLMIFKKEIIESKN